MVRKELLVFLTAHNLVRWLMAKAATLGGDFSTIDSGSCVSGGKGKQIIDLLFTKHAERGMTLVLVTHDTSLAQRCDRVVRLRLGRIDTHS